jgi:hypothetical protein
VWVPPTGDEPRRWVRPTHALLEGFVDLTNASDDDIASFARDWGVLELCDHGLPRTHNPGDSSLPPFSLFAGAPQRARLGCKPSTYGAPGEEWRRAGPHHEPLAAWRRFARLARATLDAAGAVHEGRGLDRAIRDELLEPGMTRPEDAELLAIVVSGWLRVGDVRVAFEWSGRPQTTFQARSMLGGVAHAIALTVASSAVVTCSSCGAAYVPARRPPKGRRRYCPACREEGAPARDAARDYWHRKGKSRRRSAAES